MFKSIGGFFRDIVAPIGLSFLGPAGPFIAAAYSGINTGIKTGSPLAGLGSAGLSLGLSSAFRGITAGQEAASAAKPVFKAAETTGATVAGTGGGPGFLAGRGLTGSLQGPMIPGTQTLERSLYAARP